MLTRTALMLVIGQLVNVVPLKALYLICVVFFEGGSAICGSVRGHSPTTTAPRG